MIPDLKSKAGGEKGGGTEAALVANDYGPAQPETQLFFEAPQKQAAFCGEGMTAREFSVEAAICVSRSRCHDSEEGIFRSRSKATIFRIFSISV